jgi:hypothetical protein
LLVRRQLIESGLELMRKSHLVEQRNLQDGFLYAASEEAASYVDLLESEYSLSLKARAAWLAKKLKSDGWEEFKLQVKASIGERTPAFVSDDTTKKPVPILRRRCIDGEGEATAHALEIAPTLERFATLAAIYDSDVKRLESLEEGGAALLAGSRRPCPLCGAEPADQRHSHGLDEVELSRKGARAEIDKILRERTDLERTVRSLRAEGLGRRAEEFAAEEKRTTPRSHL